jgi:hypothetical protein
MAHQAEKYKSLFFLSQCTICSYNTSKYAMCWNHFTNKQYCTCKVWTTHFALFGVCVCPRIYVLSSSCVYLRLDDSWGFYVIQWKYFFFPSFLLHTTSVYYFNTIVDSSRILSFSHEGHFMNICSSTFIFKSEIAITLSYKHMLSSHCKNNWINHIPHQMVALSL